MCRIADIAVRRVACVKKTGGRRARVVPGARVGDRPIALARGDARVKIRQRREDARRFDRDAARGIEAEEPDARTPADVHVRSQIEFGYACESRQRRAKACAHIAHPKRHDREPRVPIETIERDPQR